MITNVNTIAPIVPWVVFTPLIAMIVNLIFGRRFTDRAVGWIATGAVAISFVIALALGASLIAYAFQPVIVNPPILTDWITIPSAHVYIPWQMRVDTLSVLMMLVVTGVGTLIHIYSIGYMTGDARFKRFFIYLNLFIAFMLILVTANNYLMLFVGWEGVGLCSFLLIGFWFDRKNGEGWRNSNAARKAFIVNRVGDFGFMLAILLTFWTFGSLDFTNANSTGVFDLAPQWIADGTHLVLFGNVSIAFSTAVTIITLFMIIGVVGKSAQIPLYVWLPDAMAGPTPVSALIHAATMVTAGVYLVVRSSVLFQASPTGSAVLTIIGAVTALYAGFIALGQWDIKKVLAYSTVSQLGFMVAAAGLGAYTAAMFHLVTHAFFKGLLFLAAGSVIHGVEHGYHALHHADAHEGEAADDAHTPHTADDIGVHGDPAAGNATAHAAAIALQVPEIPAHDDPAAHGVHNTPIPQSPTEDGSSGHAAFDAQDMRNMGGLRKTMPITFWTYLIGALALSGIFPFAGFWSKDDILASALTRAGLLGYIALLLLIAAAFLTAFYMGRQVWYVFFGRARSDAASHAPESVPLMTFPLIVLAILSVVGGLFNLPNVDLVRNLGAVPEVLNQWLSQTVPNLPDVPFNTILAAIALIVAIAGLALAIRIYGRIYPLTRKGRDPLEAYSATHQIFDLANAKLYADQIYNTLIVRPFQFASNFLSGTIDRMGIDRGFMGIGGLVQRTAGVIKQLQTGYVRTYVFTMLIGVLLVLFVILFPLLRQLAGG